MNDEIKPPDDTDVTSSAETLDVIELTMDKFLDAADVSAVYGEPIQHGDTIIIPCAEVLSGMGFGMGFGVSSHDSSDEEEGETKRDGGNSANRNEGVGGGGGGRVFSRPVAVIVASPEGVRIEPVFDRTKIALAVLTTAGFMFGMFSRMMRPKRKMYE
jgi:uncharacterized spore protein YtfJ